MSIAETAVVPFFIHAFIGFMSIYHSINFILIREIKTVNTSRVWNLIDYGNCGGVILTVSTAFIFYRFNLLLPEYRLLLSLAAALDVITHFAANSVVYTLVAPIIKKRINLLRKQYAGIFIGSFILLYSLFTIFYRFTLPSTPNYLPLVIIVFIYLFIISYFTYSAFYISESYKGLGFVRNPFLIGGFGMMLYIFSAAIVLYIFSLLDSTNRLNMYYYLSIYGLSLIITVSYFVKFIVEYPSFLHPKWKTFMPFDPTYYAYILAFAFITVTPFFIV